MLLCKCEAHILFSNEQKMDPCEPLSYTRIQWLRDPKMAMAMDVDVDMECASARLIYFDAAII